MNLLAATTLSTKKQAYSQYKQGLVLRYLFLVTELDDNDYQLQIFHVTHPNAKPGKGLGDAIKAEKPHFDKHFSFSELKIFMEDRGFVVQDDWDPVEDGVNILD